MEQQWKAEDFLSCTGSIKLARAMAAEAPFADIDHALRSARHIWFNKIDVNGWLEAFAAHPEIGTTSKPISQWSKEEQTTAMATASDSTMKELFYWNARYKEKFGFVFLICASGKGSSEILEELKRRYDNRPFVELGIAAEEEMKIIELRLGKLFDSHTVKVPASIPQDTHHESAGPPRRTRPPITTHVLDTARGSPASGLDVLLEVWTGTASSPSVADRDSRNWAPRGSSVTNSDGRCGPLMETSDVIEPGFYRITFDTGGYNPHGFFPYASIVFRVRESQKAEHFHVPLLLSPFSLSTYRGS